ncbi:MAG: DUF2147 domain-containing protein [Kangiellaceae bacterium]|nr:DUF2147 domain-containing protein [Kangiellaceae bacterium]
MKTNTILLILLFCSIPVLAESTENYLGVWQTIDDKTKRPRSLITLSMVSSELTAHITKIYPKEGDIKDPICQKCKGDLKNRSVIGLNILTGMNFDGEVWTDGEILDPDNGKHYDAKIWLEGERLMVRGYIGFFFRTQEWVRLETKND